MTASGERSAFYSVGRGTGGLGDWVTLLHPPYTLWHLSYVAIGAAALGGGRWPCPDRRGMRTFCRDPQPGNRPA